MQCSNNIYIKQNPDWEHEKKKKNTGMYGGVLKKSLTD